jgi:ABC-type antimicrobial peptide transport system permease subunit
MALGANRSRVLTDLVREGLKLTIAGVLAGTASAVLLNRLIVSLLFGVAPTDATTFATAIAAIALIAGVACSLPAWRASQVDPNVVLRSE